MRTVTIDKALLNGAPPVRDTEVEPWEVWLVEGFFEALDRRDAHSIMGALTEGASWSVTDGRKTLARYEGCSAILEMLMESLIRSEGTIRVKVEGLTAGEHEATAIVRLTAHREGSRLNGEHRFMLRLEHGLIAEIVQSPEDPDSHLSFFAKGSESERAERAARVTIFGNGLSGFEAASSIVRLLEAWGATVVGGGPGAHGLSEFVLDVPRGSLAHPHDGSHDASGR